jgi:Zn-dependent alcohol dehydrogenase
MATTYKAVEVAAPSSLRIVEKPIPQPSEGQVLIRVEACGVCHTDSFTVEGQFPGVFPECLGTKQQGASKQLVLRPLNGASDSELASAF